MSLLLLGLLHDVGHEKCHGGPSHPELARRCYEECGRLGMNLGWAFENEFGVEHGTLISN